MSEKRTSSDIVPIPSNELARLEALYEYEILDTLPEENFDRITRIASHLLQTPISLISLVDEERQWFKSRQGLDAIETPREFAFCAHTILGPEMLVVEDATRDPRFNSNPLVTAEPNIRFYAGAPLSNKEGCAIGTLCVIDREPRKITQEESLLLRDLAAIVMDELEFRRQSKLALKNEQVARVGAEESHRVSVERYSGILEIAMDAIISVDHTQHIVLFNKGAEKIFGYTEDEILEQPIDLLLPARFRDAHRNHLKKFGEAPEVARVMAERSEIWGRRKNGEEFPAEASISKLHEGTGHTYTVILRDYSLQKAAQDKIRQNEVLLRGLQRKLSEYSQTSAVAQLSSSLAHELNQPLAAILNYLEAGRDALGEAGTQKVMKEIMDKAYDQAVRAGGIVGGLRDLAERGETTRSSENINDIIAEMVTLGVIETEAIDIKIQMNLAKLLPPVFVNKIQIQQVLLNIARNGIEAMANSDTRELTISTSFHDKDYVEVAVADTGPGLSDEVRDSLFTPFVSTKPSGMGLGLSICRSIIEAHKGRLSTKPNPRGGTVFRFTLPTIGELEAENAR